MNLNCQQANYHLHFQFSLWSGVILLVYSSETLLVNMCVNLCRCYIDMPQHLLHASKVRTAGQQVRSETVP